MGPQRLLLLLLLVFQPLAAWADGMVFPPATFPAEVTIPDQRALICYTNGIERLVIETRFTGSGTNFAWVVPLPGRPVVEAATTGLFPTLQYLFQPQMRREVPRYYLTHVVLILIVIVLRWTGKRGLVILGVLLLTVFLALLLPALSPAGNREMASAVADQRVTILDRKLAGVFETTTIVSHDPRALQTWLHRNGFAVSANSDGAIAGYIKDGWVFVAARVRRDQPARDTSTPQPLSFTFKTDRPVYPVRLTGVGDHSLRVELFVFGPARAEAPHFTVEHCVRPQYPKPAPGDFWSWRIVPSETLNIVHPFLRRWVAGAPVATRLTATLSPADMRQDVWLDWSAFSEKRSFVFSRSGAWILALNWGTGLFLTGLLIVYLGPLAGKIKISPAWLLACVLGYSAVLTGTIYLTLPKAEVRPVSDLRYNLTNLFSYLYMELAVEITNRLSVADARHAAKKIITAPGTNTTYWTWVQDTDRNYWQNYLQGGLLREEDSPGNYSIREAGGQLEFVVYDGEGAEHVEVLGPSK